MDSNLAQLDLDPNVNLRDVVPVPLPQPKDTHQQRVAKLQKWLRQTVSPEDEYTKHLSAYTPGTDSWAQQSAVLRSWTGESPPEIESPSCLHVRGIAGSGKSVFAARTISKLQQSGKIVLFFFFRQATDGKRGAEDLVRDFAAQLLPHRPALVAELTKIAQLDAGDGPETSIWPAVVKALSGGHGREKVYCVVDALDEMDEGDLEWMTTRLVLLGTQNPEAVRVMMTSRPLAKIEQAIRGPGVGSLELDPLLLVQDVVRYVDSRMDCLESLSSNEKRERIKSIICYRASGLFLYAKLAADGLAEEFRSGSATDDTIPESLDYVPRSLQQIYEDLLIDHSRRSGVTPEQQKKILMCVIHAARPLQFLELASLLSQMLKLDLGHAKNLVRDAGGQLLEIRADETVSVVHDSFAEFLHDTSREACKDGFPVLDRAASHAMLAVWSLEYLASLPPLAERAVDDDDKAAFSLPESRSDEESGRRFKLQTHIRTRHPFVSYAVGYLNLHLKKASDALVGPILDAIDNYLAPGKTAFEHLVLFNRYDGLTSDFNVFHLATTTRQPFETPVYVLEHLCRTFPELIDARNSDGCTALNYAASYGDEKVVEILLRNGADPRLVGEDGLTSLHQAASNSHAGVVRLLLDAGVDPLIKTEPVLERHFPFTVDWQAQRSAEEEAEARRETALHCAFRRGGVEVAKAFMPFIPPAEITRCFHLTRDFETIKMLLETGQVDVNTYVAGKSKLARAAETLDLDLIRLLLQHGADPRRRMARVHCVVIDYARNIMREIAEIDAETGPTPLHLLARHFSGRLASSAGPAKQVTEDCVRALIEAGADINASTERGEFESDDNQGLTPLHEAVKKRGYRVRDSNQRSDELLVEVLLSAGADPSVTSRTGDMPVHLVNPHRVSVLEALVKHGADINAKNAQGRTVLLEAIRLMGHTKDDFHPEPEFWDEEPNGSSVSKMLGLGADLEATDMDGDTVFHHCMHSLAHLSTPHHLAEIQTLLDAGMDLNKKNNDGYPPLWRYKSCEYLRHDSEAPDDEGLLQLLVEAGMDINALDDEGQNILWILLNRFRQDKVGLDQVKKFVRLGADPSVTRSDGTTLAHAALERGKGLEWFRYLTSVGVSLDVRGSDGNTLIHMAAFRDHGTRKSNQALILYFLEKGVAPLARNTKGQSALHAASRKVRDLQLVLEHPAFRELDVNEPNGDGLAPIHFAAEGDEFCVETLLHAGADPTALTANGLSPLHIAACQGQPGAVHLLVARYRSLGVLESYVNLLGEGRTPLHYACQAGRAESVDVLLINGADPQLVDENGLTPLCATFELEVEHRQESGFAAHYHVSDIIRLLARSGIDINSEITVKEVGSARSRTVTGLSLAVEKKAWESVRALLQCGAVPSDEQRKDQEFLPSTDKEMAAEHTRNFAQTHQNHKSTSQDEPPASMPPCLAGLETPWSSTGLIWGGRWAVSQGPLEDGTRLIDSGQTLLEALSERDLLGTPLGKAALHGTLLDGDHDSVRELASLGVEDIPTDYAGETTLHHLVDWGYLDLLEHFGAKISELESREWAKRDNVGAGSLLARACTRAEPSLHIIRFLVEEAGVNVNAAYNHRDFRGRPDQATPAHILSRGSNFWQIEGLAYLISKGADIHVRDGQGKTPLLVAVAGGGVDRGFWAEQTVRLLLDHGADPDSVVRSTPGKLMHDLHTLEISSHPHITKLLLERGADLNKCPGLLAHLSGNLPHPEVFEILLDAGLDPNELPSRRRSGLLQFLEDDGLSEDGEEEGVNDEPRYALHEAPCLQVSMDELRWDYQSRRDAVAELLLSHGADPFAKYSDGSFVLQAVIEDRGRFEVFIPRLKRLDLNHRGSHGRTALISACVPTKTANLKLEGLPVSPEPKNRAVMTEFIHSLLDNGADTLVTDDQGRTALHWYCTLKGSPDNAVDEAFAALIQRGPAATLMTDEHGWKPWHIALAAYSSRSQKSTFAIRGLMSGGTDIHELDPATGDSALHMIAPRLVGEPTRAAEAAALFRELAGSLDINGRNSRGETPAFKLVAAGLDPLDENECRNSKGSPAVEHSMALELFIELGADMMAVDAEGRTLLHAAASGSSEDPNRHWGRQQSVEAMFERLIELGVDPRGEDHELRTAIDVAGTMQLHGVVMMFEEESKALAGSPWSSQYSGYSDEELYPTSRQVPRLV